MASRKSGLMSEVAVRFGPASIARSSPQRERQPALPSVEIATVEVHTDPEAATAAWRDLDAVAAASPYQSPNWLLPWIETIGVASGVEPLIVVARGRDGSPLALLPFGLVRRSRFTVAVFLGARDSNFNMGLFKPGQTWSRVGVLDLLKRAAAASPQRVDAFVLINQPFAWDGIPNPFAMLDRQPSPSFAYKGELTSPADTFLRDRLSREGRKKLRQKLKRLQAIGPVSARRAETPTEIVEVLDAFVEQRRARSRARGLLTDDLPDLRDFLNRVTGPPASLAAAGAPVEFYALRCGERVVATFGGTRRGRRFSGMLMSFAADPDLVKTSPGELLLSEVLKLHCGDDLVTFDLGIGEARYKAAYCPDVESLFDCVVPMTARGRLYATTELLRLATKRAIKQSSWAWPLVQHLRRLLRSGGHPTHDPIAVEGRDRDDVDRR